MWKKVLIYGGIAIFILAILIQLIPYGRNHTNPPVIKEPTWDSQQTQVLFQRACADCHSNPTRYPWYSHVVPYCAIPSPSLGKSTTSARHCTQRRNCGSSASQSDLTLSSSLQVGAL